MRRTAGAKVAEIVTVLQTGQLRNCDFIHDEGKAFSSAKCPDQLWGTSNLLCYQCQGPLSPLIKWSRCEADPSLPSAWNYTFTPFLCIPLWHDN